MVVVAFALGAGALLAYTTYRVWDVGNRDSRTHVDAIVVLGAAQYNGRPSPVLAARLDHAIDLYMQGYADYFVVTGGKQTGDHYTEAFAERQYARDHGVDPAVILSETTGRSTLESMQNVRLVLAQHGLHSALFVSDRTHMLRVLRLAADQGIEGWGSPTDTSPTDSDPVLHFDSVVHEVGAMALYIFAEQKDAYLTETNGLQQPQAPSPSPSGKLGS